MNPFASSDKLVGALRTRGLEPVMGVRAGAHPNQVPQLARELQALTNLSPREALRIITDRELAVEGVSPERAKAVAGPLQAAGAYVWIEHQRTERYALPGADGNRAGPCCEWLTLVGRDLFLARGRPWDWGAMEVLVREGHTSDIVRVIDQQRARWKAAGLREAATELELLTRLSAQHPTLEASLADADEDTLRHHAEVYADWLQSHGDPRGELAIAALHGASEAVFAKLLATHGRSLLGPLHGRLGPDALRWLGPWVLAAKLGPDTHELGGDSAAVVETLLGLPVCAQLRELALDAPYAEIPSLGALLGAARCRSSLRIASLHRVHDLALAGRFDRLERLTLSGCRGALALGSCSTPRLERLALGLHAPTTPLAACVGQLDAPSLKRFVLHVGDTRMWESEHGPLAAQLEQLLALAPFATLERLTLSGGSPRDPLDVGLVGVLRRMPGLIHVKHIDLRKAILSKQARLALEAARTTRPSLPVMLPRLAALH